MKILGLITAREGSKGIPGKNIKILGHQPLLAYVIQDGLAADHLDKVVVSTDSESIAEIARQYGADVPFLRPAELAQDNTPSVDVVSHTIHYFDQKGYYFDAVCLLQPTSPFKPKGFIDTCILKFVESQADCLVSVLEVPYEYNPHWVFEMDYGGGLAIATGETTLIPRRQELPKTFHRDGSVYISKVNLIKEKKVLVGGKIVGKLSDPIYYANIDNFVDWQRAEQAYQSLFPCAE